MESTRPLPIATDATKNYWDCAQNGRFAIQKCPDCGNVQFYPRLFCLHCLSDCIEWVECAGTGHIYSYTIAYRAANPGMKQNVPYIVVLVDLPEGVRLMANLVHSPPERVQIGAEVNVVFESIADELVIPQFRLSH